MKYAYVAGPYSAKTIKQRDKNIRNAWKVGFELAKLGFFPITPHCNSAHMDGAQDHPFWLDGDIGLMESIAINPKHSIVLVLIPGWQDSPGAVEERKAAWGFGISVYYPEDKDILKSIIQE